MYDRKSLPITCAIIATATLTFTLGLAGCKSSPPAPPTDDASLTTALQSRIAGDGALSAEPIQSSVQNQRRHPHRHRQQRSRPLPRRSRRRAGPRRQDRSQQSHRSGASTGHHRRSRAATARSSAGLTKPKDHTASRKAKVRTDRPPSPTRRTSSTSGRRSSCTTTRATPASAASTATRIP